MSSNQPLSNEKSLEIIHQMINQAKTNFTDSGKSWLIWGILLFLASISTYVFIDTGSDNIYMGWNILGIITIVLPVYDFLKPKKKSSKTYVDEILKWVDIGFIVSLFTVIFSINVAVSPNEGFGFFLMIFAFLMLIKGGALQSTALKIGAIINWAGAIAIFINKEFRYDMLIMAGAVLIGYIIPGILLWKQYKKQLGGTDDQHKK